MNIPTLYQTAFEKWGKQLQMIVAMEELAELTRAISKWLRGREDMDNLAEEVADVRIMLEQIIFLAEKENEEFGKEVDYYYRKKLNRLKNKLYQKSNPDSIKRDNISDAL